jgi:hypothetical protein
MITGFYYYPQNDSTPALNLFEDDVQYMEQIKKMLNCEYIAEGILGTDPDGTQMIIWFDAQCHSKKLKPNITWKNSPHRIFLGNVIVGFKKNKQLIYPSKMSELYGGSASVEVITDIEYLERKDKVNCKKPTLDEVKHITKNQTPKPLTTNELTQSVNQYKNHYKQHGGSRRDRLHKKLKQRSPSPPGGI